MVQKRNGACTSSAYGDGKGGEVPVLVQSTCADDKLLGRGADGRGELAREDKRSVAGQQTGKDDRLSGEGTEQTADLCVVSFATRQTGMKLTWRRESSATTSSRQATSSRTSCERRRTLARRRHPARPSQCVSSPCSIAGVVVGCAGGLWRVQPSASTRLEQATLFWARLSPACSRRTGYDIKIFSRWNQHDK
jgi:hypothetical protein